MPHLSVLLLFVLGLLPSLGLAAPSWGAPNSSNAGTPPAALQAGEWIWGGDSKAMGPMAVVVSLTEQRAYVYRNGLLIGVSTVSTGKPGHETPVGVFTILQKDKDHHSSIYNNATMPYQQRLTWDGIALHAGGLPGYPESHGCVHLPSVFAQHLFDATGMGMVVVIAKEGVTPSTLVHPAAISPIDPRTGAQENAALLAAGEAFRWQPALAATGPVSMVLSTLDRRLFVMRNGVEIGRARIEFQNGPIPEGTHAYMVAAPAQAGQMPAWIKVGIPGNEAEAGQALSAQDVARVVVPQDFVALLLPLLDAGVVLLQTDQHVLPETTDSRLQVLNSDAPAL